MVHLDMIFSSEWTWTPCNGRLVRSKRHVNFFGIKIQFTILSNLNSESTWCLTPKIMSHPGQNVCGSTQHQGGQPIARFPLTYISREFNVMELWWHAQDYDAFQNYATLVFIKCEPLALNSWTFEREMFAAILWKKTNSLVWPYLLRKLLYLVKS